MAYASTTAPSHGSHSLLGSFFAECAAFFEVFGAAIRVANAVDARQEPDQRDLNVLGIKGQLPSNL
jgi:hypothetical protein